MKEQCPSEEMRRLILGLLLRSIAIAEEQGPHSWSVTLFENGFCLNVGPVEVFWFADGVLRSVLLGPVPQELEQFGEVLDVEYRSMPQPQHSFSCDVNVGEKAYSLLERAHADFVRTASVTKSGKPRRASYARYHSSGLMTYARRILGSE